MDCFSVPVSFTEADHDLKKVWTEYDIEPTQHVLPKGWTKDTGRRSLPCAMIWEKDVRLCLRDGITLLADVFRPIGSADHPVPAIMPWSPYGKTGTGMQSLDMFPYRVGIPREATSGLEKWEAPDPAEWIARGYAVVNIDARGTFKSEGDIVVYGTQEGRDGYDSIEWIAQQSWCNGKVAMAGNSWLGSSQWFIAAEQPPSLACMAPWEGLGDYYRESICRGGIPDHAFWDVLMGWFCGPNKREDVGAMVERYGLWNDYWEDKKPKLCNITVPMYATASYSTGLHTEGSLRGFLLSASEKKWLRWTSTQEWHDIYQPHNIDDLQKFFDKYMQGVDNDWEQTSPIRLSLLGYNRPSVVNRPEPSYPPPDFQFTTLFLDGGDGSLRSSSSSMAKSVRYQADDQTHEGQHFVHTFTEYTELCGFSKVKLFMSSVSHDDMDVYVVIRKLNANGEALQHQNIPASDLPADSVLPMENIWYYIGPNGRLRASHREVTQEHLHGLSEEEYERRMTDAYVYHPHMAVKPIVPGEVVELDITLWPGGMVFDAGESMRLEVKGRLPILPEFLPLKEKTTNYNKGQHVLHTGGEMASSLYVCLKSGINGSD